jgi:putative ABC transport system permease protein
VEAALMGEALVTGVLGSLIGFVAGFGMAVVLRGLLTAVGISIPSGGLVLLPRTVIVSFAVGITITVASALLPAHRGSKVPPIAAMRDVAVEQTAFSRGRLFSGLGLLAVSIALVAIGLTGELALLGLGVALLFIALFVLGPLMARPVARVLGAPVVRWRGLAGSLARQNAMRNPKRTARTAAALMVGVALVSAITVFASSAKASIREIIGKQFTGDFVVSTDSFGFGGLPVTLAPELSELPGVEAATGIQLGLARVDGKNSPVSVVDPSTVNRVFDLGIVSGSVEALDDTGILVSQARAESSGLRLGSQVPITFLDGTSRTLTVQAVYAKDELAGAYSIAKSLYAQGGGDQYDFSIFVRLSDGASAADVQRQIAAAVEPYPTATLESRSEYIDAQAAQIDAFVNLVYGLLALAVVIAVVGIANTLSLSVYERTRELGLLRAVGPTRPQIRSMVRWESVMTAVLGAAQGIVIGTGLGWAVVVALRSEGFNTFQFPVGTLITVLLLAIVCGVVAAARPARRAAKLDVLAAIHSQ